MQASEQHSLFFVQGFIGAAFFAFVNQSFQFAFDGDEIVEQQFAQHGIHIALGVHASVGVHHQVAFKRADDEQEADHLRELIQQLPGDAAFGGPSLQSGNIRVRHLGVDRLLRVEHLRERVHARVWHIHYRGVDFEASRRGGRRRVAARHRVEDGCLS